MKNFKKSDYSLNKHSKGIVYRFSDGSRFTVTLANYLAENPDKAEEDFYRLKELSDDDYLERDRSDYRQTWKYTPFETLWNTVLCCVPSPETRFFDEMDETERNKKRAALAKEAWNKLTDTQRRRYFMYHGKKMKEEKIAALEGTTQQAVSKSLYWAERKIGCKNRPKFTLYRKASKIIKSFNRTLTNTGFL